MGGIEELLRWPLHIELVNRRYSLDDGNRLPEARPEGAPTRVVKEVEERFWPLPPGVPVADTRGRPPPAGGDGPKAGQSFEEAPHPTGSGATTSHDGPPTCPTVSYSARWRASSFAGAMMPSASCIHSIARASLSSLYEKLTRYRPSPAGVADQSPGAKS